MSFMGKKGMDVKSISSMLKDAQIDTKVIQQRIGSKHIEDLTHRFTLVFFRYSMEKAANFCTEHELLDLTRDGLTVKEILYEKNWNHQAMLRDLLDFLTWGGFFRKKERAYYSIPLDKQQDPDLLNSSRGVATLKDMSPFGLSHTVATPARKQVGLQPDDKKWLEKAKGYKIVFALFDRILSRFISDSMRTGTQSATLDDRPEQLGLLMDSFFRNPSYTIPRMGVIAAAFKKSPSFKILVMNCGTGCCIEELLLFNPQVEVIGVTDNSFHQRVADRNLAVFSDQQRINPHIEWRVVQYSQPLLNQLEDLMGECDLILVNQLFQFYPHDTHQRLADELQTFLKPGGIIACFQHLRAEPDLPWPHEWLYRVIQGFSGIPNEKLFKEHFKGETDTYVQEIIPLTAYLAY